MEFESLDDIKSKFKAGEVQEFGDEIFINGVRFHFSNSNNLDFIELATGKAIGMMIYNIDRKPENVQRFEEIGGTHRADEPGLHEWVVFAWKKRGAVIPPLAVISTTAARVNRVEKEQDEEVSEGVEIKPVSTSEKNVSQRQVTYDVYIDGEYHTTFHDVVDALDFKEKHEAGQSEEDCEMTEAAEVSPAQQTAAQKKDAEWQARTLGKTVNITFPQFGRACSVKGKVDTGANISSLHAEDIKIDDGNNTVTCKCPALSDNNLRMKVQTQQAVRSADGGIEYRPVVLLDVNINGKAIPDVEFNLNDRSKMNHDVLVGHNILEKGKFIIDPTMEGAVDWDALNALFEDIEHEDTASLQEAMSAEQIYKLIKHNDISFDALFKQAYTAGIETADDIEA